MERNNRGARGGFTGGRGGIVTRGGRGASRGFVRGGRGGIATSGGRGAPRGATRGGRGAPRGAATVSVSVRATPGVKAEAVSTGSETPENSLITKLSKTQFSNIFLICLNFENEIIVNNEANNDRNQKGKKKTNNKNNNSNSSNSNNSNQSLIPKENKPIRVGKVIFDLLFNSISELNYVVVVVLTNRKMKYSQFSKDKSTSFQCEQCLEIKTLDQIKIRSSLRRKLFFAQKSKEQANLSENLSKLLTQVNSRLNDKTKYLIQFPNFPIDRVPANFTKLELADDLKIANFDVPLRELQPMEMEDPELLRRSSESSSIEPSQVVYTRVYYWIMSRQQADNSLPKSKYSFLNTIKPMCSVKVNDHQKLEISKQIAEVLSPFFHSCEGCSSYRFVKSDRVDSLASSFDPITKEAFDKVVATLKSLAVADQPSPSYFVKFIFFNFIPNVKIGTELIFSRLVQENCISVDDNDNLLYQTLDEPMDYY